MASATRGAPSASRGAVRASAGAAPPGRAAPGREPAAAAQPVRGRSDPARPATPDRPRVARRRAQAGRLDRRHRAVAGARLPRRAAGPLSRPARARRRRLDRRAAGAATAAGDRRRDGRISAGRVHRPARRPAGGERAGPRRSAWSPTSRPASSRGGAGFSSRATPATAPRCVSTGGRASPGSAGFPIWSGRGGSSSCSARPQAPSTQRRETLSAPSQARYHWARR